MVLPFTGYYWDGPVKEGEMGEKKYAHKVLVGKSG
jgi:hypothetical protein